MLALLKDRAGSKYFTSYYTKLSISALKYNIIICKFLTIIFLFSANLQHGHAFSAFAFTWIVGTIECRRPLYAISLGQRRARTNRPRAKFSTRRSELSLWTGNTQRNVHRAQKRQCACFCAVQLSKYWKKSRQIVRRRLARYIRERIGEFRPLITEAGAFGNCDSLAYILPPSVEFSSGFAGQWRGEQ